MTKQFLKQDEAARVLGVSPRTLETWRSRGGGPPFRRFGRAVRYSLSDLEGFAQRAAVYTAAQGRAR